MFEVLFGLLFWVSAAGSSGEISPYMLNDLSLGAEPPPCLNGDAIRDSFDISDKGRAKEFSVRGTITCEHQIFDQGERDQFINFLVDQVGLRAKTVAQSLYDSERASPELSLPIFIKIKSASPRIDAIVRASFTDELVNLLGAGSVARLAPQHEDGDLHRETELTIDVLRVDASDLLFQVSLDLTSADGTQHRRSL